VRNAKNIYRRRSLVYDTVGHAPLAIDRLLNVRTTLDVLYWSYTDTKHRAASFRQQNFLSGTGFRRRFSVIVPYIIGAPYKLLIRVLFIKPQLAIARLRLHASMMSICLSVCCQNAKTRFSQKLSNLAMVSIYWRPTGSYVSLTGLFKDPLLHPYNPRWLRSAILIIDMTYAEGGPIWIKFRRLVQNDMLTAVKCGNGNQMQNSNIADVWANSMACHSRATYHIAGCCHLVNSLSLFHSHMPHCSVQSPDEINVVIVPHCRV